MAADAYQLLIMWTAYNVSPEERALIEKRAAKRAELKREWRKLRFSPYEYHTGFLVDEQLQRQYVARANVANFVRPTLKNFFSTPFVLIYTMGLFGYLLHKDRSEFELACREGRLSYEDRPYKKSR